MNRVLLAMLVSWFASAASAAEAFQPLDRIDGWLIERRLDNDQEPICRASVVGVGTWFSERVRITVRDDLIIPEGLASPDLTTVDAVRDALIRCRESLLYL